MNDGGCLAGSWSSSGLIGPYFIRQDMQWALPSLPAGCVAVKLSSLARQCSPL